MRSAGLTTNNWRSLLKLPTVISLSGDSRFDRVDDKACDEGSLAVDPGPAHA